MRPLRSSLLALGAAAALGTPLAADAFVINFHDANNGQLQPPGTFYDLLYVGQGAVADPGNNIWNGFGHYPGPGSTYFYGTANPYPASNGNPGNPYAAYFSGGSFHTTSGPKFGSPGTTPPGTTPAGNVTSDGTLSPITLSANFGGDNGATGNTTQGQPSFLLAQAAIANGAGAQASFVLHNVPAGTYRLYLYGANYNNDRGTLFSMSTPGTPHNGIAATLNQANGVQPGQSFIEGVNYVFFDNVTPNVNGDISFAALPNPADGVGNPNLPGEVDVNGFQLVSIPEPSTIVLGGLGSLMLVMRKRRN